MDVDGIKRDRLDALRKREVIMIIKSDYGYEVERWTPNGVAPVSPYDTVQEAAARALQLLHIKEPVTPQNWPEAIGLGPDPGPPPKPKPQII